jgi:hypothetical protein
LTNIALLTLAWLVALPARSAHAQIPAAEPDPASVRVRIGPLSMNPTIALTNLGVDTNVFNQSDLEHPQRDFTLTVEPRTDLWLRVGRTWFNGEIAEQVIWYQKFVSERSSNHRFRLGWTVPLNRLAFAVNGIYRNTRERPGFEIDARAERVETTYDGTIEYRAFARTYFGAHAARSDIDFAQNQVFRLQDLETQLNRKSTTAGFRLRNQVTPLTSVDVTVDRIEDRFEFSPQRDADSTAMNVGVKFDPFALIKGRATVGYRVFEPASPEVPEYSGVTLAVDLSYVLLGSTRFSVQATRDVSYSIDVNQPYYLQTGITTSIAQQLFGPVDIVGQFAKQRLSYRTRADAIFASLDRVDHVISYGIGFGYHLGRDLRIGVNVDQSKRESPIVFREYDGLKFGTSVTYGL